MPNTEIITDTSPSVPGRKTSSFLVTILSLAATVILPALLAYIESISGNIPANTWVAIIALPTVVTLINNTLRYLSTSKEREVKARIVEAQATIVNKQLDDKQDWKDIAIDIGKTVAAEYMHNRLFQTQSVANNAYTASEPVLEPVKTNTVTVGEIIGDKATKLYPEDEILSELGVSEEHLEKVKQYIDKHRA